MNKKRACSCPSGSRTVGLCTHSACIVYYLSHGIYLKALPNPGFSLNNILIQKDSFVENVDI